MPLQGSKCRVRGGNHSEPRVSDVPTTALGSQDFLDQEDANVDRKISGICRGC